MTLTSTNPTDVEWVYLGDGPGQSDTNKIGKTVYTRGQVYSSVPFEHLRRGGFHTASRIAGGLVVRGRPVKRGIVLGTAPSMWDDLDAARAILGRLRWSLIAVNGAGWMYIDPIAMWCSVHGFRLVKWIERRRERGLDMGFTAYANFGDREDSADVVRWNRPNGGGSSGLYATLVALELGYDRLILCGIPITGDTRHNYDSGETIVKADCAYEAYRSGWIKSHDVIKNRVRSMSGWTREQLGVPTEEWLRTLPTDSGTGWSRLGNHTPDEEGPIPPAATNKERN
jgi:hypothetical protein